MAKVNDTNSNDGYQTFLDKFKQDKASEIFNLLRISETDLINMHEGILGAPEKPLMVSKRWQLSMDILSAYMMSDPKHLDNKAIHPSTQKKALNALHNSVSNCKETIHDKVVIFREKKFAEVAERDMADNNFLNNLRGVANKLERTANPEKSPSMTWISPCIEMVDGGNIYDFDRKIRTLYNDLEWLENCLQIADESIKSSPKPRGNNKYEWTFFIMLCNVFYKYTGKVPDLSYGGGTRQDVHENSTLKFLKLCYEGFGLPITDTALFQKMKKLKTGKVPQTRFAIKPAWL